MIQEIINTVRLSEVMAKGVVTVRDSDPFHIVLEKFIAHDIRHLPVVNDAGCVTGLISQRQLYKISSPRRLEDGTLYYDKTTLDAFILKNVMIKDPHVMREDQTLKEAMYAMAHFKLGCIPIVDIHRFPLGIITRVDVINFFLKHE